jgi:SAM-dependent methyltransferase
MLRLARILTRSSLLACYLQGGAEALPLPGESASVVWSIASVHHWADLDAGLREEARRVLRPAGRLVAIERRTQPGARGHASHGWTDRAGPGPPRTGSPGTEEHRQPALPTCPITMVLECPPAPATRPVRTVQNPCPKPERRPQTVGRFRDASGHAASRNTSEPRPGKRTTSGSAISPVKDLLP